MTSQSNDQNKPDTNGAGLEDLTADNLTQHVIKISANISNERVKFIFSKLIQHAHDFIRETELQRDEWEAAWKFLTDVSVGKACQPDRQEMILLSDVLGISALVDTINSRQSPGTTESSVLGPFHNEAHFFQNGDSISSTDAGETMLIRGTVRDLRGKPVAGALLDIWETNGNGKYDMQDPERDGPDCRGKFYTDENGRFFINGVRPVDYPVPYDGPVGVLLDLLNRQAYRPAHVHFVITHPSYESLTTALYDRSSPRLVLDPVFGAKTSLTEDIVWCEDLDEAKRYGSKPFVRKVDGQDRTGFWILEHDFILADKQAARQRKTHD
ncbi:Intradiol ring-cleavage dioxygenase [Thermoascus aurantiacus ATCC 26904]